MFIYTSEYSIDRRTLTVIAFLLWVLNCTCAKAMCNTYIYIYIYFFFTFHSRIFLLSKREMAS